MEKEGKIRIRKDGSIELRVSKDGVRKSFYGANEAAARRQHREYKKQLGAKKIEYSKMSVSVYIENWLTTFKFGNVKDTSYQNGKYI